MACTSRGGVETVGRRKSPGCNSYSVGHLVTFNDRESRRHENGESILALCHRTDFRDIGSRRVDETVTCNRRSVRGEFFLSYTFGGQNIQTIAALDDEGWRVVLSWRCAPQGWDIVAAKRQTQCHLSNARARSRYCRFSRTWRCFLERLDRGKHAGVANTHRESHRDSLREPVRQSFQPDQEHPQSAPCLERCVARHVAIPESNRIARIPRTHRMRSSRNIL